MGKINNKIIYTIQLSNWERHNPKAKKHYKKTLIPNNLIHDAKLKSLPVSLRWMWINLLLIGGDMATDRLELGERQVRDMLESSWSIARALDAFQSFQMLTWSKSDFLRIERREKKEDEGELDLDQANPSKVQEDSSETAHHQKTKITQKRKDPLAYMKSSFSGHTEILRDIGFKAFHQDAELILKIWPTVEELSEEVCKVYTGYGQKNNVGVDAADNPKTQRDLKAHACKIIGSIISKEKKVYEQC